MKTIVIHNRKGGVGKTSITGNLAYILSKKYKVLLLDTDGQANLSNWLLTKQEVKYDLGDVLAGMRTVDESIQNIRNNLDIIPLFSIGSFYQEFVETKLMSEIFIFQDLKEEVKKLHYHYLLIDTPPQGGILLENILSIADEVLLVLNGDTFSIDGLEVMDKFLKEVKRKRRVDFVCDKIVFNKMNKSYSLNKGYLKGIKSMNKKIYIINQYQQFANCIAQSEILTEKEEIESLNGLSNDL